MTNKEIYRMKKSKNEIQYFILEYYLDEWKICKIYYSYNKAKYNLLILNGEIKK